jgi:methyl-accepting chemotaxis protein
MIQQTHGMIETHFGIFALLAFLVYYRDWRPVVAAAGVIAVHHLAFNFMQASGLGVYVLASGANLGIIIIHAAYVVVEAGVLVFMAIAMRREALESLQVAALAESIGQGNLTTQYGPATLAKRPLLAKMAEMQSQLGTLIGAVNTQTTLVSDTSRDLADNARLVGDTLHQQSEATTSMAAGIQELTVSITHISENTAAAEELARESEQASSSGAKVVNSAIGEIRSIAAAVRTLSEDMDKLGVQFDNVTGVVTMIKDIAGQTNLLALNAAIEAARAGEQGRGFAVVADEVRKLAEHTSKATEDINRMMQEIQNSKVTTMASIDQAVGKAESGVALAAEAGSSIETISARAQQVQKVVSEIDMTLREQSIAATEIAQNVERISAMSETSSAAADSAVKNTSLLHQAAQTLAGLVVRFRLS